MTEYLEPEQALVAAEHLGLHIRDRGLLLSALARPSASAFGADAYPTIELKAAALMSSVARNHALFDGNKRFSWFMTLAFLALNDLRLRIDEDVAFDLVVGTAQGALDLDEIAAVIRAHLVRR